MALSALTALSPLDGRYGQKTEQLRTIVSEYGLIYYRLCVEIDWLVALSLQPEIQAVPKLSTDEKKILEGIKSAFDEHEAARVKAIEKETNHDVKAIEYYLREQLSHHATLSTLIPFIHFGCTSEDINNLAYALMIKTSCHEVILPTLSKLSHQIDAMACAYANTPMLSRTHGQPATPTTLGKELKNFVFRLNRQQKQFAQVDILGKWNGAVGNYNAQYVAYPNINWPVFAKQFVESLGLTFNPYTTQIEPHDFLAEIFDTFTRFNHILIDFSRDIWSYISLNYFKQKTIANEVGSSTMPHKVNPIDFENAEGNLGIANALATHLSHKLPISRFQRDLTDSTVLRNIGTVFGYALVAYQSLSKGINKLSANDAAIIQDLDQHWEILAEPIQTVMRCYGIADAYEQLKKLTRGEKITAATIKDYIEQLDIPQEAKSVLIKLTPTNYLGHAVALAEEKF